MKSPIFSKGEHADKGKRSAQCERDGGYVFRIANRQPLLKNASGTKMLPKNRIEIFGIEQTGPGRSSPGRRIDRDHIVLLRCPFQKASAVVDYYVG